MPPPETPPPDLNLERCEKAKILEALRLCGGNIRLAALALGISERTLSRRLKAYVLLADKVPVEILP